MKKILSLWALIAFAFTTQATFAAVQTVECTSDGAFWVNSCDQCFTTDPVKQGETVGLLTDEWENTTTGKQVMYKEEQEMPKMLSLNLAEWSELKAGASFDFWQFTPELEALYSEDEGGYVLDAGQKVTWIESTIGSAYKLDVPAPQGQNTGLLTYDVALHDIGADGIPEVEPRNHRECVLIKSAAAATPETPVTPETPTELPQTGPEHVILGLVALLLGAGIFVVTRKKA